MKKKSLVGYAEKNWKLKFNKFLNGTHNIPTIFEKQHYFSYVSNKDNIVKVRVTIEEINDIL